MIGSVLVAVVSPLRAKEQTEDQLIAIIETSPNADTVAEAMLKIEKAYPTSTKAFPALKAKLIDPREKVRRKAARVLGVLHADVDSQNLKDICAMLNAKDPQEQMDALKALRGLKAQETIPQILPMLDSKTPNVVRDACRTLAVLGDKDLIPKLEPVLNNPNSAVKKDAQDAIYQLKAKP